MKLPVDIAPTPPPYTRTPTKNIIEEKKEIKNGRRAKRKPTKRT